METTVSQRIKILIDTQEKGNKSAFGRTVGITAQSVADIIDAKGGPSFMTLQKILRAYPSVSSDWFLFGEGQMLKGQQSETIGLDAGSAVVAESETLLKLAVAESQLKEKDKQLADKDKLIDRLWLLNGVSEKLGKMLSSSDAALARFFKRVGQSAAHAEMSLG